MYEHKPHPGTTCGVRPSHAWRYRNPDTGDSGIVYCQSGALSRMAFGYDIEIGRIDYYPGGREITWGCV